MKTVFKTLIISFITNTVLVLLKLITGLVTNTSVLIADSFHSLSDLITDIIAIAGNKLSEKKEDEKHPKGHGKIQYITSIIMGLIIMVLAFILIKEVFTANIRIIPKEVLVIVIITIILKYTLYKYIYKQGNKSKNNILIASAKESMTDVLSSICVVFVVISSLLSKYLDILKYSDKVGTFIVSLFVLKTGYQIIRENLSLIIGEVETNEDIINEIKEFIKETDGVECVDDIVLEKYGIYYDAIVKIGVDKNISVEESHDIGRKVKHQLLRSNHNIKYVSIHINPYKK